MLLNSGRISQRGTEIANSGKYTKGTTLQEERLHTWEDSATGCVAVPDSIASMMKSANSEVPAFPPTSRVNFSRVRYTFSNALRIFSAASYSPRWRSISREERKIAVGF